MMKYTKKIIENLTSIGERQLEGEKKARKIIETFLKTQKVEFVVQEYITTVPNYLDWGLNADGENIDSLPCGFKSGKIIDKNTILSSLISSQKNFYDTNINFNPLCDFISRSNHYMAPALAINKKDVQKVIDAQEVEGFINVDKVKHKSANILVGNLKRPENIIFCHYDSIEKGVVDNASGVAVSLNMIAQDKNILEKSLFVIAGNEEISYDEMIYWGHGYRVFQEKYIKFLEESKNIFVLDSFGYSSLEITSDPAIVKLGFPIKNMEAFIDKIKFFTGSFEGLMPFYHAKNDTIDKISDNYLQECNDEILKSLV